MSDDSTRARVVDAAIACILDEGFYRASSNKIARRAGVTWGVIQYHFGTREALMVAVHERGLDELDRCLTDAVITGDTVEARARVVRRRAVGLLPAPRVPGVHAGAAEPQPRPDDRRLHAGRAEVGRRAGQRAAAGVGAARCVGPDPSDAEVERIGRFLYNVVRGLALDQELLEAMPIEHSIAEEFDAQRAELVRGPRRFIACADGRVPNATPR